MSERVTVVLTEYQRQGSNACLCGWSKLGHSFPAHQAEAVESILFSEEAIERSAKRLFEREGERDWGQRCETLRNYYRADIRAVVAALRGEA